MLDLEGCNCSQPLGEHLELKIVLPMEPPARGLSYIYPLDLLDDEQDASSDTSPSLSMRRKLAEFAYYLDPLPNIHETKLYEANFKV